MRLRKDQIEKLSQQILEHLKTKKAINPKTDLPTISSKIRQTITQNLAEEDQLDQAVEKLLDQYRPQIQAGHLNERDLFLKIKKELAKKRNLVL